MPQMERAGVHHYENQGDKKAAENARTSTNTFLEPGGDEILQRIDQRVARLLRHLS